MITINQNLFDLTIKAISANEAPKINKFIKTKHLSTTFISEKSTLYVVFDKKEVISKVKGVFLCLAKSNKEDANIDLDSFSTVAGIKLETIFMEAFIHFGVFCQIPYVRKQTTPKIAQYNIVTTKNLSKKNINKALIITEAMRETRFLQEMPANLLYPEVFCNLVQKAAEKTHGLSIKVYDKSAIEKMGMGLLLGVNKGSSKEPRLLVLEYQGNPNSHEKIAFVGKGITFDTGGYNIKIQSFMRNMKFDMGGAAITANALIAMANLKIKANVVGICALAENTINSDAIHSDDILTSMSKKTVEIINTDAEGRLVLGDAVHYADTVAKANKIITIATLTGAIQIALGHDFTGAFSQSDKMYNDFAHAANLAHEPIWRMPLIDKHLERLQKSRNADINQIPEGGASRKASSSLAAAFMALFINPKKEYLHLDIAGTDVIGTNDSTACMLRTFIEFAENHQG